MSTGIHTDGTARCGCSRPAPDGLSLCPTCLREWVEMLARVPAVVRDLDDTLIGARSPSLQPGGKGKAEPRWAAASARSRIRTTLVAYARMIGYSRMRLAGRRPEILLAAWLTDHRADLARHPDAGYAVEDLRRQMEHAEQVIDNPPAPAYLGTCPTPDCPGAVYSRAGSDLAVCRACGAAVPATERRDALLAELDDRLVTAAEAARLSTYLGLRDPRERVRARLNTWHKRGRIKPEVTDPEVRYRFGIVWRLLVAEDERAQAS